MLWSAQQSFRAAMMGSKKLMRTARVQLRELLRSKRWVPTQSSHPVPNTMHGTRQGLAGPLVAFLLKAGPSSALSKSCRAQSCRPFEQQYSLQRLF